MRKRRAFINLSFSIVLVWLSLGLVTSAFGWGQLTHAYIAQEIAQQVQNQAGWRWLCWDYYKLQAVYGATVADIQMGYPKGPIRDYVYVATHKARERIWDGDPGTLAQKAFALGWMTHGHADEIASPVIYLEDPPHPQDFEEPWIADLVGYIEQEGLPVPPEKAYSVASRFVEAGGELVLIEGCVFQPQRLTQAASLRSLTIPPFLKRAYPEINGLLVAEGVFRLYLMVYGQMLAGDVQPMAGGVRLLVSQEDGVDLTLDQSVTLLNKAMGIVESEYMYAVGQTILDISGVSPAPPSPLADRGSRTTVTWGKIKNSR